MKPSDKWQVWEPHGNQEQRPDPFEDFNTDPEQERAKANRGCKFYVSISGLFKSAKKLLGRKTK
jgi:hypothetical protein